MFGLPNCCVNLFLDLLRVVSKNEQNLGGRAFFSFFERGVGRVKIKDDEMLF